MIDELFNSLTRAAPEVRSDARAFLSGLLPVPPGEPQQLHLALGAADDDGHRQEAHARRLVGTSTAVATAGQVWRP